MAATDLYVGRQPLGVQDWSVFNSSGSAMVSGTTVKVDTAHLLSATQGAVGVIPTAANGDEAFGVLIENIPAGAYGRVQVVDGTGVWALSDATGVTAGTQVMPSATAGTVTTWTTGPTTHTVVGVALTAGVNLNDPVFIKLTIRGTT